MEIHAEELAKGMLIDLKKNLDIVKQYIAELNFDILMELSERIDENNMHSVMRSSSSTIAMIRNEKAIFEKRAEELEEAIQRLS